MRTKYYLLPVLLLGLTLSACGNNENTSAPRQADQVPAEAHLTIKAANYEFDQQEYHLKVGVPTEISLVNTDGNHGLSIQGLNVKLNRDHSSAVVTATEAGTYQMNCSIPCGPGHKNMKATLVAE